MTWLAIRDADDRRFSLFGLGAQKQRAPVLDDHPSSLLTRGTLLIEAHPGDAENPQQLFGFAARAPWQRGLSFWTVPGGGVSMTQRHGSTSTHAKIRYSPNGRRDVMRITFAWDSRAKWGRLTLEHPEEAHVTTVMVENPAPLALADIRRLMLGDVEQTYAADMIFAALSDHVEPVGPMPTLLSQTPVATPWGYRMAGDLQRGDTVMTRDSGVVPIIHHVSRVVPARGSYRPLRLRAPYFGLQQDLVVSPEQRLLIDGPEVEYLFGCEAVLVPARHLVNGFTAHPEPCGATIRYDQLLLPKHETLLAAGGFLESLYIGRIRRNANQLGNSLLEGLDRAGLPEHGHPSHQVLRQFEAIHLARRRAA